MARYHIKDDGTPGRCSAASPESCPKTQAGDSFHGTLEEATAESERRFEASHSGFATRSKAEEAAEAQAGDFLERFEATVELLEEEGEAGEAQEQFQQLREELSAYGQGAVGDLIRADRRYVESLRALGAMGAVKIGGELEEAFGRQSSEAEKLQERAAQREAAARSEGNERKIKRAQSDGAKQAARLSELDDLRGEAIGGQLDGSFDHKTYGALRAKAPEGELALGEDLKGLPQKQLDVVVATGKFWNRAGVNGVVHGRTVERAVETEKRRRLHESTVEQLEKSGYKAVGGGFYEHPSQPGEQFRLGATPGEIYHLRPAARKLGESSQVAMTSDRAIREAAKVASGGTVDRSQETFELTRDSLPEAWKRLKAAGIERPLGWEDWGSSERDLWMEGQLRRLDRDRLLS